MSTRAHVIVKDGNEKHYLYHHFDGYPEGVGAELRNIFKNLNDEERFDSADDFCQWISDHYNEYEYEDYGLHGDEEYVYVVDFPNNKLTCYSHGWDEQEEKLHKVVFEEPIYKEEDKLSKSENDMKYQIISKYYEMFDKIVTFKNIHTYFTNLWPEIKDLSLNEYMKFLDNKKNQYENEIKNNLK